MNSSKPRSWEQRHSAQPVRSGRFSTRTAPHPAHTPHSIPASASAAPSPQRTLMVALGCAAVFLAMVVQWPGRRALQASAPNLPCQQVVQAQASLSRESLLQLLAVPERTSAQTVRDIVQQPYCVLPAVEMRAGITSEREIFPLAFDPQTWLVVLYEDGEYAGYAFHVNR